MLPTVSLKRVLLNFKIWLYVPAETVAYPRKISQNQFYQLLHIGKWRCTIAISDVGTASIQNSPNRNSSINNVFTHSKQDAVEMISKLDRLNIKKGKVTLKSVCKSSLAWDKLFQESEERDQTYFKYLKERSFLSSSIYILVHFTFS